ncbi:MAG: hypothetical protein JZU49_03340 [Sulfuricurvum sp.]|nr:hypothetical protein [Sulfuricurvum sp.]
MNEYTRTEFGNPHRFEKYTVGQDRKFPNVSVRFSGALLISGTLVITDANEETYSGWLQSELGVLGTAQRDKFINEMPWKTGVTFENKTAYNHYLGDEYACVPIVNPAFWEGKGRQLQAGATYINLLGEWKTLPETMNELTLLFREFKSHMINRLLPTMLIDIEGPGCVVSPYLFLSYVVNEIFRMNGFFVDSVDNPLENSLFQPLIYNNYNILKQEFALEERTTSTWNQLTSEEENVQIIQVTNTSWSVGTFTYADLVPKISLKDFILGIQNNLNLVFHFKQDKTVKIIERNNIPSNAPYDLDAYFLGFWSIGERKDLTLKFEQKLDEKDEIFDNVWHDLSDRRTFFKDAVDTLAELQALPTPEFGDLRLVREVNKIYEYKWAVFTAENEQRYETQTDVCEWKEASIMPQPFFYGTSDEIEEITSNCSLLHFDAYLKTQQKGNISSARSLWSDFSFRLLSYGLTGSLNFHGDDGLFENRWKKWAHFWKNRLPVEGEFNMPLNILYYVIDNITQPYRTRHGKFIIEEMEVDFQGDLMGNVKIKGYKLD